MREDTSLYLSVLSSGLCHCLHALVCNAVGEEPWSFDDTLLLSGPCSNEWNFARRTFIDCFAVSFWTKIGVTIYLEIRFSQCWCLILTCPWRDGKLPVEVRQPSAISTCTDHCKEDPWWKLHSLVFIPLPLSLPRIYPFPILAIRLYINGAMKRRLYALQETVFDFLKQSDLIPFS